MKQDPRTPNSQPERKPLVTVEFQQEVDVSTGNGESRMFVKMYFDARDSGLLREMPADLWQLLCCLSTYMDPAGNCFPSQQRIAEDLGLSRETVNRKLRKLLAWRFNGKPVIRATRKTRNASTQRWVNNRYEILPISSLGIFDTTPFGSEKRHVTHPSHGSHVSNSSHGLRHTESGLTRHTNQNQSINEKTFNVERDAQSCSHDRGDEPCSCKPPAHVERTSSRDPAMTRRTLAQRHASTVRIDRGPVAIGDSLSGFLEGLKPQPLSHGQLEDLVTRIEDATGDRHSQPRFRAIAQRVPQHVIEQVLASIKSAGDELRNRGAFFEKSIQTECQALEIELPAARRREVAPETAPPGQSAPRPNETRDESSA